MEVDLDEAIAAFRKALDSVEDILEDPEPDFLPWDFNNNNVDIVVRWWTKSQRTYEVRTRSQVIHAIKRECEAAGIALPADTKISFAEPEFVVVQKKSATPAPKTPAKPKASTAAKPADSKPDERKDPEAEKPKEGELNENEAALPR